MVLTSKTDLEASFAFEGTKRGFILLVDHRTQLDLMFVKVSSNLYDSKTIISSTQALVQAFSHSSSLYPLPHLPSC